MPKSVPNWETELWSYLSEGDGIHCPIYQSCRLRLQGGWCLSEHPEHYQQMSEFVDNEDPDFNNPAKIAFELATCPKSGRIFELVKRLAVKYQTEAGIDRPPVPTNLITRDDDNIPIEVRKVSLKAHHGSIWRLNDCWLVQLNNNDTAARQRFTLYHEIFHVLAHCKATEAAPVFRKKPGLPAGSFNELLADHFAVVVLTPDKLVKKMWSELKDISQIAARLEVPKQLVWFVLKHMQLI